MWKAFRAKCSSLRFLNPLVGSGIWRRRAFSFCQKRIYNRVEGFDNDFKVFVALNATARDNFLERFTRKKDFHE
jgi:hypothetical protein